MHKDDIEPGILEFGPDMLDPPVAAQPKTPLLVFLSRRPGRVQPGNPDPDASDIPNLTKDQCVPGCPGGVHIRLALVQLRLTRSLSDLG